MFHLKLLHNGSKVGSITVGHSMKLIEYFKERKFVKETLQYSEHNWKACGDLYTKHSCFAICGA